jgi:hypothetical protein
VQPRRDARRHHPGRDHGLDQGEVTVASIVVGGLDGQRRAGREVDAAAEGGAGPGLDPGRALDAIDRAQLGGEVAGDGLLDAVGIEGGLAGRGCDQGADRGDHRARRHVAG